MKNSYEEKTGNVETREMIKTFSADRSTLPESIIQILLDIYAEKTGLPVALYQVDSNKLIWSKKGYYSPLCTLLSSDTAFHTLCSNDHIRRCLSASGKLELCHVGLWNIALPIRIDDELVSVLLTGQRRLKDITKNQSSFNTFSSFLSNKIESKVIDSESLRSAFESTPSIDHHAFDSHLLESLSNIHAYIHSWASSINEEDKILKRRLQLLAHEFLLPIQSILANAENLYDEIDNPELKEIAENIMQEMQRLALIAENMRGSMLQGKEPRIHYGKYNLYKCLIKNIEIFGKEAEQKGIAILKPYTSVGNFPEIAMSPDNMTRAFANLIHNAIKYSYHSTSRERYISVEGIPSGKYYCVKISNYGVGILPEEIASGKIFSYGYRGLLSSDRYRSGSGLGLSEVKKIVEQHNGYLKIESSPKGQEVFLTVVSVFLPYEQGGNT